MNIVQIQNRVQELPNTPQTMQYLNAAMNGQVATVPPYVAAAELKRRETEGMMDQLAKGAAQGPQPTVKDQLQQKAGIMALMGQQQGFNTPMPPQRQAQPQAESAGIDSLPVGGEMFGMAGGGIVGYNGEEDSYVTPYDRMNRENEEAAQRRAREAEAMGLAIAADPNRPVMRRLVEADRPEIERKRRLQQEAQMNVRLAQEAGPYVDPRIARAGLGATPPEETVGTMGRVPGTLKAAQKETPPAGVRSGAASAATPQQTAQGVLDLLRNSEENKAVQAALKAPNPYATQESQADYIKRMREGILSQIPGGKLPWETSEERLKGIEARRAKEDAEYQARATGEGRRLDNLATLLSGMGAGSFGMGGAKGVQAVQAVERSQREDAQRRQDLRDQQAMKLMEIRALNDQAQFALAQGNVQAYEKYTQEAKKLQASFEVDRAKLAEAASKTTVSAAGADQESRDRAAQRATQEKIARITAAAREGAGGDRQQLAELKALQASIQTQLKDPRMLGPKGDPLRSQLAEINALIARMAGLSTIGSAPGAPASPGGTMPGWGPAQVVK